MFNTRRFLITTVKISSFFVWFSVVIVLMCVAAAEWGSVIDNVTFAAIEIVWFSGGVALMKELGLFGP